jgi:hypothetical protein
MHRHLKQMQKNMEKAAEESKLTEEDKVGRG